VKKASPVKKSVKKPVQKVVQKVVQKPVQKTKPPFVSKPIQQPVAKSSSKIKPSASRQMMREQSSRTMDDVVVAQPTQRKKATTLLGALEFTPYQPKTDEEYIEKLLKEIVPQFSGRNGGYTRIIKLGKRRSDSSEMVLLEWVGIAPPERKKKPEKPQKT